MPKPLLLMPNDQMLHLHASESETGMGFYVVPAGTGLFAVLSDGSALPLQQDPTYYDVTDLIAGTPWPQATQRGAMQLGSTITTRALASAALLALVISPHYAGAPGAFPLIASWTLPTATVFHRYLRSQTDLRYSGGSLSAGTYLTTDLDATYANSGFAAVGRFALPMPLPAIHVLRYELPARATIQIGTVSPLFGQAGGGVEIHLPTSQPARALGSSPVPAF